MASEVHRSNRRSSSPFDILDRNETDIIAQHVGSNSDSDIKRPVGSGIILNQSTEKEEPSVKSRMPHVHEMIQESKRRSQQLSPGTSGTPININVGDKNEFEKALEYAKYQDERNRLESNRRKQSRLEKEQAKKQKEEQEDITFEMMKNHRSGLYHDNYEPSIPEKEEHEFTSTYYDRVKVENKKQRMSFEKHKKADKEAIKAGKAGIREGIRAANGYGFVGDVKAAGHYIGDITKPTVNKVLDIVENPETGRKIKKGLGVARDVVHDLNEGMIGYGQAKAIMNGNVEVSEEAIRDKNGNIVGYKRVLKNRGGEGNKKTGLGLKAPIKHRSNKPGPGVRHGTIGTKHGTLINRNKGTLGKNQGTLDVDEYEDRPGPVNRTKEGIGHHRRSGVKLVKSSLPTLPAANEGKDGPVNNSPYKPGIGGIKEPVEFEKKSFAGFEKKSFAGFEKKPSFHPINKNRARAPFESQLPPGPSMLDLGKKKR